ncbi:MAG: HEAT repeat domain-containing protein [Kofleriaceae bacterium]
MPRPQRFFLLALCASVALLGALRPSVARADGVDTLIEQLDNSSEKVRLSAVLSLTKLRDPRAIAPLQRVLLEDSDRNVRSASAVGLAKLVTSKTADEERAEVLETLAQAAKQDASSLVRKQATNARAAIEAQLAATQTGKIYVDIGPMASKASSSLDSKLKDLMRKSAQKALGKAAPDMLTTWPGGKPSRGQLAQKRMAAFYLDGTLTEIKLKEKGASTFVSCKISLLIATYPDKSMFAFLQGSASVSASRSAQDIELAHQDCVSAVIEDMIAKKAVAALHAKAGE